MSVPSMTAWVMLAVAANQEFARFNGKLMT